MGKQEKNTVSVQFTKYEFYHMSLRYYYIVIILQC